MAIFAIVRLSSRRSLSERPGLVLTQRRPSACGHAQAGKGRKGRHNARTKGRGYHLNAECGMRNAECGIFRMRNGECGMRNPSEMWNAEWRMRNLSNAECGVGNAEFFGNVECGIIPMRNAECGMRNHPNVECGMATRAESREPRGRTEAYESTRVRRYL